MPFNFEKLSSIFRRPSSSRGRRHSTPAERTRTGRRTSAAASTSAFTSASLPSSANAFSSSFSSSSSAQRQRRATTTPSSRRASPRWVKSTGKAAGSSALPRAHHQYRMHRGANETAMDCKLRGNELFKRGKYHAAIDAYTEAITQDPRISVYFSNRAMSFLKLKKFEKVNADAKRAVELDKHNAKGLYLLGLSCRCIKQYDDAVRYMEKAVDAASRQKKSKAFIDEIRLEVWRAIKLKWEVEHQDRLYTKQALHSCAKQALAAQIANEEIPSEKAKLELQSQEILELLEEKPRLKDIPDYLSCTISMDIMFDPVLTPSGHTYDRKHIVKHLQSNGNFDPVTREKLRVKDLYPNILARDACEAFLRQHPYAFESEKSELDRQQTDFTEEA